MEKELCFSKHRMNSTGNTHCYQTSMWHANNRFIHGMATKHDRSIGLVSISEKTLLHIITGMRLVQASKDRALPGENYIHRVDATLRKDGSP